MKWKSKDGSVVKIRKMGEDHLKNAIAYCEKNDMVTDGYIELLRENRRRLKKAWKDADKTLAKKIDIARDQLECKKDDWEEMFWDAQAGYPSDW